MFNLDGLINVVFRRGERLYECTQVLNNYELYYVIMQCDKF